jgi:hypothetical protein
MTAVPVAAHEHATVGPYEFTVGWLQEPALANVLNGLDVGINETLTNGTSVWVLGAENNLTAILTSGPSVATEAFEPQEDRPGWYTFPVIPTIAGSYSVRIQGDLSGTSVNITVALDDVQASANVEFPLKNPTPSDLQGNANELASQISSLDSQLATATGVAIAAIVFGIAGTSIGVLSWRRARKKA